MGLQVQENLFKLQKDFSDSNVQEKGQIEISELQNDIDNIINKRTRVENLLRTRVEEFNDLKRKYSQENAIYGSLTKQKTKFMDGIGVLLKAFEDDKQN
jgi:hypothetical protein